MAQKVKVYCKKEEERTKGSFKDEVNINTIMRKYEKTGQLPDMIRKQPIYGDFSTVTSYQDACEIIEKAHMQFNALSADVRMRFNNDPAKFLEFATNPENKPEMVEMGLAVEPKVPDPKPEEKTENNENGPK